MKSGRLGTPDIVAHIRQQPLVGYELESHQGSPWLWADGEPMIDLLDATIDWMIDNDGSRWFVIDTEYQRQHVAHYALLPADTWRQRLRDAGVVEVD